ncbi:hypothetical protein Tco_0634132 [Tanacetum coccineum]
MEGQVQCKIASLEDKIQKLTREIKDMETKSSLSQKQTKDCIKIVSKLASNYIILINSRLKDLYDDLEEKKEAVQEEKEILLRKEYGKKAFRSRRDLLLTCMVVDILPAECSEHVH